MPRSAALVQHSLPGFCPLAEAVDTLAGAGREARGAVYTKSEVVEFMLDLAGYTPDKRLHTQRLLEPSFGDGEFLIAAARRLLAAYKKAKGASPARDLKDAIRAVELHRDTFAATRTKLIEAMVEEGVARPDALALADAWLAQGDFLLADMDKAAFDYVIGNPPYIRQEMIPQVLIDEYRRRYPTIYDRADIYVPFIERGLRFLKEGGALCFICADRWMKNRYGGPLRALVAKDYNLRAFVDMVDTPAFDSDVIAYPAIFVIAREPKTETRIAHRPAIEAGALSKLAASMTAQSGKRDGVHAVRVTGLSDEPWMLDNFVALALVRRLEAEYKTLEEEGCKVGIGVATGADKAFIGALDELDVEDDRKLPLAMTRDIASGAVVWRGLGVVNPFLDDGKLAPFDKFPRFGRYLEARRAEIAGRHVAQKTPANWYRTIDRIYPALAAKPKLLIPDIKGAAHIVFEEGKLYPHHNLYFITAEEWDLRALQAVLKSGIASLFVSAYSTKMRGGYLRFQAQYLRRIRVPAWASVPDKLRMQLQKAAHDPFAAQAAAAELYQLTDAEIDVLAAAGKAA